MHESPSLALRELVLRRLRVGLGWIDMIQTSPNHDVEVTVVVQAQALDKLHVSVARKAQERSQRDSLMAGRKDSDHRGVLNLSQKLAAMPLYHNHFLLFTTIAKLDKSCTSSRVKSDAARTA